MERTRGGTLLSGLRKLARKAPFNEPRGENITDIIHQIFYPYIAPAAPVSTANSGVRPPRPETYTGEYSMRALRHMSPATFPEDPGYPTWYAGGSWGGYKKEHGAKARRPRSQKHASYNDRSKLAQMMNGLMLNQEPWQIDTVNGGFLPNPQLPPDAYGQAVKAMRASQDMGGPEPTKPMLNAIRDALHSTGSNIIRNMSTAPYFIPGYFTGLVEGK